MEIVTALITLFTTAKSLGFDLTFILTMMCMALMLLIFCMVVIWKLVNPIKECLAELTLSVKNLNSTMDKRMSEGEQKFAQLDEEINKIKTHVGLK